MSSSTAATSATAAEPLQGSEKTRSSLSNQDNLHDPTATQTEPEDLEEKHVYSWGFWAVFAGLVATTLLSALDGAIVATALPTIAETLHLGPNYVWVANIYWLTG